MASAWREAPAKRALVAALMCLFPLTSQGEAIRLGGELTFPVRVDEVELRGLWLTRPEVLLRELPFREGEVVSEATWRLGRARLWNTGLVSRLDERLERRGEAIAAVFEVEEKFTPSGIFAFQAGGGTGFLQLGLYDINLLGRFVEAGALFERFDRFNGGQAWFREPRLFGKRLDAVLLLKSLVRPRPGFDHRRSAAHIEISAEPNERLLVSGFTDLFADSILDVSDPAAPPNSWGAALGSRVRLGRIDTERLRQRGVSLELKPSLAFTTDRVHPRFVQLLATALAFATPGERWTLGLRAMGGWSSVAPAQHLFYLGGLDVVRGYSDNTLRADTYAAANAEVRFTAFDSTWLAAMPVAFIDAALARAVEGSASLCAIGLGARIVVPRMNRVGIRADLAFPLRQLGRPSFSLGVYQFF